MSELYVDEKQVIGKLITQSWSNLSYVVGTITAARKDNIVTLSFIYTGNNSVNTLHTVMTLPPEFRPAITLAFDIVNSVVDSFVQVNTDGTIKINYNAVNLQNRGTVSYIALNN